MLTISDLSVGNLYTDSSIEKETDMASEDDSRMTIKENIFVTLKNNE